MFSNPSLPNITKKATFTPIGPISLTTKIDSVLVKMKALPPGAPSHSLPANLTAICLTSHVLYSPGTMCSQCKTSSPPLDSSGANANVDALHTQITALALIFHKEVKAIKLHILQLEEKNNMLQSEVKKLKCDSASSSSNRTKNTRKRNPTPIAESLPSTRPQSHKSP